MTQPRIIRFRNDTPTRRRLYQESAMAHPAKGHLGMWQQIISEVSEPGDTVLDVMAGVGSTLMAALMGRNAILVELEQHFIEPMAASWEKMKRQPMLGAPMGEVLIIRGDARMLPLRSADSIITSPPFADQSPAQDISWLQEHAHEITSGGKAGVVFGPAMKGGYTRPKVDSVVSSPPWEDKTGQITDWVTDQKSKGNLPTTEVGDPWQHQRHTKGYIHPEIDSVVSSPPYEDNKFGGAYLDDKERWFAIQRRLLLNQSGQNISDTALEKRYQLLMAKASAYTTENIGNQRGQAYWDSMRLVYAECYRVLKPHGKMALVLKGFTRDGKYVDLPTQTQQLVESLGFRLVDRWLRELWSLSFWRILQRRRDPEAFDDRLLYEEVLIFERDGQGSDGVAAAVFSPPYEGVVIERGSGVDWNKSIKKATRPRSWEKSAQGAEAVNSGYTRLSAEGQGYSEHE